MRLFASLPLLLVILSYVPACLMAQMPVHEEINLWFQEERFIIADQNDDALLDQTEMKRFASEFGYYLDARHYELTDHNKDGLLSFHEILDRSNSEKIYRYSREQRELRQLSQAHPTLAQASPRYLKSHPDLVRRLFSNLLWLSDHPKLAASVYDDKGWTNQHPETLLALHRNLRWMVANPTEAKSLYRNRQATQYLPELLSWRADHKDFIHKHPTLSDFYRRRAFFPGAIGNR